MEIAKGRSTSTTTGLGYLELLGEVCGRFNWTVHAYCLMTNHYHLIVETPDANLSIGMHKLKGVYTQASMAVTIVWVMCLRVDTTPFSCKRKPTYLN